MRALGLSALGRLAAVAPLVLRIGLGVVFVAHGYQKFDNGPGAFASGPLAMLNVPAPEIVAWLMTLAEGIGGLLLIVGLLTRLATLPLIAILIGAVFLIKDDVGFIAMMAAGAELDTALLAGLVALLLLGPGRFSLDAVLGIEPGDVANTAYRAEPART